jgi:hypothetical protein
MHAIGALGDRERKPAETRLRVMLEAFAEPLQELNPALTALQAVMLAGSVVGGVGDALAWAESESATDHSGLALRLVAALVAGAAMPGLVTESPVLASARPPIPSPTEVGCPDLTICGSG